MADKLTLRGVKRVEEYTTPTDPSNREVTLKRPTTGKDQFTIKRWWASGDPKRYVNCTCFNLERSGNDLVLAVVSNQDTRLRIFWQVAGADSISFPEIHSVERIGIFSADMATLYRDVVIPKIPGVEPQVISVGAIPAALTINSVVVRGEAAPNNTDTDDYSAAVTGDATPYTYAWTITGGTLDSGQGTATATVTWGAAGAGSVKCEVGSTNSEWDGTTQENTLPVTIS